MAQNTTASSAAGDNSTGQAANSTAEAAGQVDVWWYGQNWYWIQEMTLGRKYNSVGGIA